MGHQPYALHPAGDDDEVTADSATPDAPAEKAKARLGSEPLREGSNKSSQTQLRGTDGCQHSSAKQPAISTFYKRTNEQSNKRQRVQQPSEKKQAQVIEVDLGDGEDELQQAIRNSLAESGSGMAPLCQGSHAVK